MTFFVITVFGFEMLQANEAENFRLGTKVRRCIKTLIYALKPQSCKTDMGGRSHFSSNFLKLL